MFIKTITIPTPRRIKEKLKNKNIVKKQYKRYREERIAIHSIIGGSVMAVLLSDVEHKILPIWIFLYCILAYEITDKTDMEILKLKIMNLKHRNNK